MDLIKLVSPEGQEFLANPNAIETVYPPGSAVRDDAYVRFMSGEASELPIDEATYQLLRRGLPKPVRE